MIAISAFADEIDQDLAIQIAELRQQELKHIEFRAAWGKNVLDLDDAEIDRVCELLERNMMRVSAVGSPIGKIKITEDFDAHVLRFQRALWVADRFNTPYIRVFSFYGPDGKTPIGFRDEVIRRLRYLTKLAEDAGKILCHENEANIYGDLPNRCVDLLESVRSPAFRAVFDPANFIMEGLRPFDQCWRQLKPFVAYFHIKDAVLATRAICPAGAGDGQIEQLLRDALADGFDGFCSLEPHLKHAGQFSGQTGPELFHVAARAFKEVVERAGGRWRPARAAIVGCGMIARFHLQAIADTRDAVAVAIMDRSGRCASTLGKEYNLPVYNDLEVMLDRAQPDYICVCTPSGAHLEPCLAAAQRGIHVLVEKPLEITAERCDAVIEACRAAKVRLGVVFQSRFDSRLRKVKELIDSGRLGRVIIANAYTKWFRSDDYYRAGGWRGTWALDGGGALMNQAIHYIDLLLWLAGDVEWVAAQMGALRHDIETEDHVVATLRFKNGALGSVTASTAMWPGFERAVEIVGTRGTVIIRDDTIAFCRLEGEDHPPAGLEPQPPAATGAADPAAGLRGRHAPVMREFVDALLSERSPALGGEEGRRSVHLIEAIYASARAQAPVML